MSIETQSDKVRKRLSKLGELDYVSAQGLADEMSVSINVVRKIMRQMFGRVFTVCDFAERHVLDFVKRNPGTYIPRAEIAKKLGCTVNTVSDVILQLERDGKLSRANNPPATRKRIGADAQKASPLPTKNTKPARKQLLVEKKSHDPHQFNAVLSQNGGGESQRDRETRGVGFAWTQNGSVVWSNCDKDLTHEYQLKKAGYKMISEHRGLARWLKPRTNGDGK